MKNDYDVVVVGSGSATGGVIGVYLGGGNGIGPPAAFGRIADAGAGAYAKSLAEAA